MRTRLASERKNVEETKQEHESAKDIPSKKSPEGISSEQPSTGEQHPERPSPDEDGSDRPSTELAKQSSQDETSPEQNTSEIEFENLKSRLFQLQDRHKAAHRITERLNEMRTRLASERKNVEGTSHMSH
jgi:hypothetical protein